MISYSTERYILIYTYNIMRVYATRKNEKSVLKYNNHVNTFVTLFVCMRKLQWTRLRNSRHYCCCYYFSEATFIYTLPRCFYYHYSRPYHTPLHSLTNSLSLSYPHALLILFTVPPSTIAKIRPDKITCEIPPSEWTIINLSSVFYV